MTKEFIKSQAILPRIDGVEQDLLKLKSLGELSLEEFAEEDNFVKGQFYLRRALEGVFHIGSHILARMPGGRAAEYEEIAIKLGGMGIVEKSFAQGNLKSMAGYRNRLTHFYADVTPKAIYKIIQEHLIDFKVFLQAIRALLKNPGKFNLELQ
ncbi:MAG TPA: HepT-like ribonuclease domain-containing protein, partial [Candidatus Manganitrophaceae bacterium]